MSSSAIYWIVALLAVALMVFMHRGHGGHGDHVSHGDPDASGVSSEHHEGEHRDRGGC